MPIPSPLLETLRAARRVTVLTGAGVSAESGVPTFRDALSGLWERFKPEDLATPEAFARDPALVWRWYAWRRELVAKVEPNPSHHALAALQERLELTLITQNVDGLHQRAGSEDVIELHGNISRTKCFSEDTVVERWEETGEVPPRCPRCGAWLRPDVVWFGESLPQAALARAIKASRRADLFLSVGTSGLVYPAAGLPFGAIEAGVKVVELNPDETPLTPHATWSLRGPSGVLLPELLNGLSR